MTEQHRDEIDPRVARALDADGEPRPLRPMWPEIERRRARGSAFDLGLASATAAAVAAGFLIGALTFNGYGAAPIDEQTTEVTALSSSVDWADTGPRIEELYLLEVPGGADGGETQ